MGKNYYDILGVPKSADEDQLKKVQAPASPRRTIMMKRALAHWHCFCVSCPAVQGPLSCISVCRISTYTKLFKAGD